MLVHGLEFYFSKFRGGRTVNASNGGRDVPVLFLNPGYEVHEGHLYVYNILHQLTQDAIQR